MVQVTTGGLLWMGVVVSHLKSHGLMILSNDSSCARCPPGESGQSGPNTLQVNEVFPRSHQATTGGLLWLGVVAHCTGGSPPSKVVACLFSPVIVGERAPLSNPFTPPTQGMIAH